MLNEQELKSLISTNNKMKYLPFEKISYKTHLEPEAVRKRVHNNIEPKQVFRMAGLGGNQLSQTISREY